MKKWTKKDYKDFCDRSGIRYSLEEGANPISPTKRRKYDDHLYWTGTEEVGVWISRPTKTTYNNMKKRLLELGCTINQDGDCEGTFMIGEHKAYMVAALIGANKNNVSDQNKEKMRERMLKYWENKNDETRGVA